MKIAPLFKSVSKILLLITFFVPLVVTRFSMFPLVFGKTVFFNVCVELALLFFALSLLADFDSMIFQLRLKFSNTKHNWVLISALLYLCAVVISTIFAQFHYTAFWGSPDRNDGLFAYLHYGMFIILSYTLFSKRDWGFYLAGFAATALFTALVAWAQFFGFTINLLYKLNASTQPGSYAGNPAYLAAFLTMFLVFFAAQYKDIKLHTSRDERLKKVFLTVFVLFIISTVLITGIRGALLGVISGVSMYAVLKIFLSDSKKIKLVMSGVILLIVLLSGIFVATRSNPFWLSVPTVKRLTSISFQNSSVITRLYAWKTGLLGFLEHPIVGSGHESFGAVFNKLGNAAVARYGDEWFDRPHNKVIEVMVNTGSLGLLSYLFMLGVLVYVFRKEPFLVGCLTAYFVQNLFIFDNNMTSVLMSAFIAYSAQRYAADSVSTETKNSVMHRLSSFKVGAIKFASMASILLVLYIITSLQIVQYNQQLKFGVFVKNSSVVERTKLLDSFLTPFTPMQPRMRMQLVEFLRDWDAVSHAEAHDMVTKAIKSLEEAVNYEPYEARYYMRLGEIYTDIAMQDKQFFKLAESFAQKGLEIAPTQQKMYYLYAFILGRQSKYDLAIEIARRGIAIDPGTARAYLYLALPGIASSDKTTNIYYNPSDFKFAQYKKEGIDALYKSFDLGSKLISGTPFKGLSSSNREGVGYTQFELFEKTDFTNMALLFSRIGDLQKTIQVSQIGLFFYKNDDSLYQYLLAAQIALHDTQEVLAIIDRIAFAPYGNKLPISLWRQNVSSGNWDAFNKDAFIGRHLSAFASQQMNQAVLATTSVSPLEGAL